MDQDAIKATATKEGREAETARVKEVLAESMPGFEAEVLGFAVDGTTTGAQVAQAFTAKQREQMSAAGEAIVEDARTLQVPEAETTGLEDGGADLSAMSVEDQAKALWAKDPAVRKEFVTEGSYVAWYKKNHKEDK